MWPGHVNWGVKTEGKFRSLTPASPGTHTMERKLPYLDRTKKKTVEIIKQPKNIYKNQTRNVNNRILKSNNRIGGPKN